MVRFSLAELGRRVRALRIQRGLSQERLAVAAGLSPRYVSQLETGRGNISILRLDALARALGVPLHELVRVDGEPAVLALVGLRGAGKTTVGRRLGELVGLPFYELDRLVEEQVGLRLDEIFALHGEAYYRKAEREALGAFLARAEPAVLATGGGLVTDRTSYELLKRRARTVWLRARPEEHLERVAAQGDRRPMAGRTDPLAELRALLREREPLYAEADLVVETSGRTPEEIAREIAARCGLEPRTVGAGAAVLAGAERRGGASG